MEFPSGVVPRPGDLPYLIVGIVLGAFVFIIVAFIPFCLWRAWAKQSKFLFLIIQFFAQITASLHLCNSPSCLFQSKRPTCASHLWRPLCHRASTPWCLFRDSPWLATAHWMDTRHMLNMVSTQQMENTRQMANLTTPHSACQGCSR